jgi:hypothetical protein
MAIAWSALETEAMPGFNLEHNRIVAVAPTMAKALN